MPRLRSVLQQRADRFRKQQANKKQLNNEQSFPLSSANNDDMKFTVISSHAERDGSGSMYSIEAKNTNATAVESFSSGEENTAYSNEYNNGEFLDLAYEASRQQGGSFEGHDFIDLVEEASANERVVTQHSEDFAQPETIEFVDSEDGKVFNITQELPKEKTAHDMGMLQNVRSLDDSNTLENDECSKTLNTNNETLQSMPSLNEEDIAEAEFANQRNLQIIAQERGEFLEECDLEAAPNDYENSCYDEGSPIDQDQPQLYDCDDGAMYYPDATPEYQREDNDIPIHGYEEDGTFFEQLRSVHSRQVNQYQTYPESMGIVDEEVQAERWNSVSKQNYLENSQNPNMAMPNNIPVSPHLEDPYMSDGNSSWEEGSFATGASRTLSRVDTACEDDEDDDNTYETFDAGECYSDDDSYPERESERPIVRLLKKFRDMNVNEEQSDCESIDEDEDEEYEEKNKRSKYSKRRNKKRNPNTITGTIFESIREIGTDILDETIDYAESFDRPSRSRNGRNEGGTILDTFTDLFACGTAPSRY